MWDRVGHMNKAREAKPASGGKLYKRPVLKLAPSADEYDRSIQEAFARFQSQLNNMQLSFERSMFPERFEEIPF